MIQKIAIILFILIILGVSVVMYFGKNKNTNLLPIGNDGVIDQGTNNTESGVNQATNNGNPPVMRTGATIDNGSGVSVTIITNGPEMRAMTPQEKIEFQKKLLGK